jgi:hypothetical protein
MDKKNPLAVATEGVSEAQPSRKTRRELSGRTAKLGGRPHKEKKRDGKT